MKITNLPWQPFRASQCQDGDEVVKCRKWRCQGTKRITGDTLKSSRREDAHLLVNPIPKLTIVLIWKTPPYLNFGKTSNRAVKNLPQRKLSVWAANDARSHKNFELRGACAFSETIDLRTLELGLTSTRCPSTTSERVTNLHILVPAITRGTLARPHARVKKGDY